eukprot:6119505-Pleurochrysis_carterae.AAC.1
MKTLGGEQLPGKVEGLNIAPRRLQLERGKRVCARWSRKGGEGMQRKPRRRAFRRQRVKQRIIPD